MVTSKTPYGNAGAPAAPVTSGIDEGVNSKLAAEIEEYAAVFGLSIPQLFSHRYRIKLIRPAKYVDPADPSRTWSGRGRQPRWLRERILSGAKLDDFRIAPAEPLAAE